MIKESFAWMILQLLSQANMIFGEVDSMGEFLKSKSSEFRL
jgi:hypothetical protein